MTPTQEASMRGVADWARRLASPGTETARRTKSALKVRGMVVDPWRMAEGVIRDTGGLACGTGPPSFRAFHDRRQAWQRKNHRP